MEVNKIEKYLQAYLDDALIPQINNELVGEGDDPIRITIHKINFGESNPNRINVFLDMDPDWSKGSITHKLNLDISRFFQMLGIDKNLHIYWNKRPLF
tara:strand:+ start:52 stop:345 length:294 start_codon:yes stop_codon:yes gene_type:complete